MVIAFGGPLSLSRVLWKSIFEIQHETKIHSLTGSEMDRAVVSLVSGASATLHVPLRLHLFGCIFLHVHFICMHLPFIVHSFPFIVLPCLFHWYSFPFMFLSYSFQYAFMSSHLPFICTHVPFILHSCPFMSFLKLWKWLQLGQGTESNKWFWLSYC